MDLDASEPLKPRLYQEELLMKAKEKNSLICLGTGAGKTYVAILLLCEYSHELEPPYDEDGKRTFFLVPTRPLVKQQASEIVNRTRFTKDDVGQYTGDLNVDFWSKELWLEHLRAKKILVMTRRIFLNMLNAAIIPLTKVNLLIFDEAHHAAPKLKKKGQKKNNDDYNLIMDYIDSKPESEHPRILGLSASLINANTDVSNIKETVSALEKTYKSTCTSVTDPEEVRKYATDPNECIWEFNGTLQSSFTSEEVKMLLDLSAEILFDIDLYNKTNENATNGAPISTNDLLKCTYAIRDMHKLMGPWCAVERCDLFIEEFENYIQVYENANSVFCDILKIINDMLKTVKGLIYYSLYVCGASIRDVLFTFVPNKMKRLLDLLMSYNDPNKNLSGIVFVEQRDTCVTLCKWLQKLAEKDKNFKFLKIDYVVGAALRPGIAYKLTVKTVKQQTETLRRFRVAELNLLIATSILEEGLDVRQCNLVVRYDGVYSYRAWVQSQGRARSKDGEFVVFSDCVEKTKHSLREYRQISHNLQVECQNIGRANKPHSSPYRGEVSEDEKPLVHPITGGRVTLNTAKATVFMYCSRLPSDAYLSLNPYESVKRSHDGFQCIIRLPINSLYTKEIEGPVKLTESKAKDTAYLKVCRILREIDEIDESYIPYTKQSKLRKIMEEFNLTCLTDSDENCPTDGPKPGTVKREQIYLKSSLETIFGNDTPIKPFTPSCLYSVIVEPKSDSNFIGFICSRNVPFDNIVSSFPVYIKNSEFTVSVKTVNTNLTLSSHQLNEIHLFHQIVFHRSLGFERKSLIFNLASPIYVVPLDDSFSIDWNLIQVALTRDNYNAEMNHKDKRTEFVFNKDDYSDALVYRWYKDSQLFEVLKVDTSKSSNSRFCDSNKEYATYIDYYREKYDLKIIHPKLPLLKVDSIGFKSSVKRSVLTKAEKKRKPIDLVPELVVIFPIPRSVYRQYRLLPAVFYRLCQVFHVEQLRERIAREADIGCQSLPANHSWGPLIFDNQPVDRRKRDENKKVSKSVVESDSESDTDVESERSDSTSISTSAGDVASTQVDEMEQKNSAESLFSDCDINELRSKYMDFNVDIYTENMKLQLTHSYGRLNDAPQFEYGNSDNSEYVKKFSMIRKKIHVDDRVKSFDVHVGQSDVVGPSPSLLLQAVTTKNAIDMFDMERLETLGDSFLKLTTSAYFYHKFPVLNEGYLSMLKVNQISNYNLYRLGKKRNLAEYMAAHQFQPRYNWLPPGFLANIDECIVNKKPKGKGAVLSYNKFLSQPISDKRIADCCEALIGAYLLTSGPVGGVKFMNWLGIRITDSDEIDNSNHWLGAARPGQATTDSTNSQIKIRNLSSTLTQFEEYIDYSFRDKCFLVQAMTHVSYHDNTVTDCYQRLEFLGDAVLDYLITRYIFEDPRQFSPGDLTDLRAALTNNAFFGALAVKHKFHLYLKLNSFDLYRLIHSFAEKFNNDVQDDETVYGNFMLLLGEDEVTESDDIDIPKALGDVFESVAGAIYLDSNYSLDAVWRVFYPLMKKEFEEHSKNIPRSPLSLLYEKFPKSVKFSKVESANRRVQVTLTVNHKNSTFTEEGVGKNSYWAKNSAAKRALRRKI
ncbi:Endoribonuclease Dicer [Pseudolycoriella hygida]|uniref:Endoribonuclease Dicer n=1 Tax=Pseudolycoriella hygida TaxID=35572 RepID=A0A9Q0N8A2_9DIPT|nr:Endoribonuclease Dicer [Pseudolycoriella hygida]